MLTFVIRRYEKPGGASNPSAAWCSARHCGLSPNHSTAPPDELFFHVPSSRDGVHRGVVLECEAQGDPRPDYKWTKNNHEFDYASQGGRILHQPGRGTLVITAPNDGDEGLYQCHATNKLGTSASNAVNMRKAELKSFPIEDSKDLAVKKGYPPTIAEGPNNVTRAVVRSNVTLRCRALGAPRPDVLWDKDGQSLREARYHVMDSGDLRISGAQLADDGEYVCRATNKFGLVSASSLVEVQRRTRMTHRPPNDYEVTGNLYIPLSTSLSCYFLAEHKMFLLNVSLRFLTKVN
ncbi:hypothetical protein HPB48_000482 [Haemaphysalis longicornis]|uniref:Ig-like domain-containing protein n=1 Tax=Haemaphysalis longicornis TaxID=44386 RepID=A0A9J6FE31_HAELO|nr:hypothetical protein HPB48_000482 [Haemaphysalis longicornis]